MVTREQAIQAGDGFGRTEFHYGECIKTVGPRGGETLQVETWRSNGRCTTWKTRPAEFRLPLKYGFKGPYMYLDQGNAGLFHRAEDCSPTVKTKGATSA